MLATLLSWPLLAGAFDTLVDNLSEPFWYAAVLALAGALVMVFSTNAVHSALALVLNFFGIAVLYLLLDAQFLAVAQVVVYAGAIMVLFLFVIMLLGVDRREDITEKIPAKRIAAYLGAGALTVILVITMRDAFSQTPFRGLEQANAAGNTEGLGRTLFTDYLFPFEVTSILLIVAAIGAVVIGHRRKGEDDGDEGEGDR